MKVFSDTLECLKCGHEAHTIKEFASGKCSMCGGELEEEDGDVDTERDMGIDRYNF